MPQAKRSESLPTAAMSAPETSFNFDENTNQLTVTTVFDFNYPDEAVINRYGRVPKDEKGNPRGEPKPITQKTYGVGKRIFTGSADAEDNPMFLTVRLYAETTEAEAEAANSGDEE